MDPLTEGQVAPGLAGEVELVRALPAALVAVGGAPQQVNDEFVPCGVTKSSFVSRVLGGAATRRAVPLR